jgi:hypothetical protein
MWTVPLAALLLIPGCATLKGIKDGKSQARAGIAKAGDKSGAETDEQSTATSTRSTPSRSTPARSTPATPTEAIPEGVTIPAMPEELKVKPAPAVRTVTPHQPGFCRGSFKPIRKRVAESASQLKRFIKKPQYSMGKMPRFACSYPKDKKAQVWLAAFEQQIVNETGMPQWALDDYLSYYLTRSATEVDRELGELKTADCPGFENTSSDSRIDKTRKNALRGLFCGYARSLGGGIAWFYDRTPQPGDILFRSAALVQYFKKANTDEADLARNGGQLVEYIFFKDDIKENDEAAFRQAIDKTKLTPAQRHLALRHYFTARLNLKRIAQAYERLAKKNAVFAKIIGPVPSKGFTSWVDEYKQNREMVETVLATETAWLAEDTAQLAKLSQKLRRLFTAYVRSKKPQSQQDVKRIALSPIGYITLTAIYRCAKATGNDYRADALGRLVADSAKWRGPRTAAAMEVYKLLATDKPKGLRLEPRLPFSASKRAKTVFATGAWDYQAGAKAPRHQKFASGVVKAIEHEGDRAKILFRQGTVEYPIIRCKKDRPLVIERIDRDGKIHYHKTCRQVGKQREKRTVKPILIDKELAKSIKAGNYIRAMVDAATKERLAYPVELFKSKEQDQLLSYYGIPTGK